MKNLFALFLTVIVIQSVSAQDEKSGDRVFKKFKVDMSFGYAMPQTTSTVNGTKAGVLFAIEPKYAILDQLSVGLRMEVAVMANIDINGETGDAQGNASYLLTGDYYFTNKKFRPFAGAGAGVYTTVVVDENTVINSADDLPTSSKFGFMARLGFEYGHLRIGGEYNFVADKAGYLGLKLGVCFGGGRKK